MAEWTSIDDVDLNTVAGRLHTIFEHQAPQGYLDGKTAMRNALEESLHCSELEAEEMVDTLEARGFIRFDASPEAQADVDNAWTIDTNREE